MTIKSFRGLMTDSTVDTITLHTNTGSTGYRIVKFEMMFSDPGATSAEHVMKIYKVPQTTASVDGVVDFSDNTLLAAGYIKERGSDYYGHGLGPIVFDSEIFNQDIYVTHEAITAGGACNYYIELEQVKLDLNENTVATLKDIRNIASQ